MCGLCVFLISYTQKVTVIYAARLSRHFGVALIFSHAVRQSASTGSPRITDKRKKPASEPGSNPVLYIGTLLSLTHHSDINM